MTTLITGSSGFIGRNLVSKSDICLVRTKSGANNEVVGDLNDIPSLHNACQNIDLIYHCAGYVRSRRGADPKLYYRVNYEGTKNLIQAAAASGVKRFVFLSSVAVMQSNLVGCVDETWPCIPESDYGKSKFLAENIVQEIGSKFGLTITILRPPMVYGYGANGPFAQMASLIKYGLFPPIPEVGNMRSVLHISDLVSAIRLAGYRDEQTSKIYYVADPKQYSSRELYNEIRDALRLKPVKWSVPEWMFRLPSKFNKKINSYMQKLLCDAAYSPRLIQTELSWESSVTLKDGLKDMFFHE